MPSPHFVGRKDDLDRLDRAAAEAPLVTITGPGGIGKTTLLRRWLETTKRPSIFVDAGVVRTRDDLVATMARALGCPVDRDPSAAIDRALSGVGAVVAIDNVEQVVGAAAELLQRWMDLAPDATFVVTSREPLALEAELRLDLTPLSADDGAALFVAHASRICNVEVSSTELAGVKRIVSALDGSPLAIVLASSRLDILSVAELEKRLDDRFSLLRSQRRDIASRHATLRDAIDWSWQCLTDAERVAIAELSVFASGFAVESAEVVLSSGAETVDLVQSLRRKSLVFGRGSRGVTRLALYESVRAFAVEQLEEMGTEAAVRARHAELFASRAAGWRRAAHGPSEPAAFNEAALEHAEIIAAFTWAKAQRPELALAIAPRVRGAARDARPHAFVALARRGSRGARASGRVSATRGGAGRARRRACRVRRARRGRGRNGSRRSLSVATTSSSGRSSASRSSRGRRAISPARPSTQTTHWHARKLSATRITLGASHGMMGIILDGDDADRAGTTTNRRSRFTPDAATAARRRSSSTGSAAARTAWGRSRGRGPLAEQALALYAECEDPQNEILAATMLGMVAHEQGDLALAERSYERARAQHLDGGDMRTVGSLETFLGLIRIEQARFDEAQQQLGSALAIHRTAENAPFEALTIGYIGVLALMRDERGDARRDLERAVAMCEDEAYGHAFGIAVFSAFNAALAAQCGEPDRARRELAGRARRSKGGSSTPRGSPWRCSRGRSTRTRPLPRSKPSAIRWRRASRSSGSPRSGLRSASSSWAMEGGGSSSRGHPAWTCLGTRD